MKIYFYPHQYLRDRQIDVIRTWPSEQVLNPELSNRKGSQVSKSQSLTTKRRLDWKRRIPLPNFKRRPKKLPSDAVVYVWGAVILSGRFIVDLDNPFALTGYNTYAMNLYKNILRTILTSKRCIEIRCMSHACRLTLRSLFGDEVYQKATVHYPSAGLSRTREMPFSKKLCRFLFIGTQFEVKGGKDLLEAFENARRRISAVSLQMVTYLPTEYQHHANRIPGVTIYDAEFSREEICEKFYKQADVLVHPSYMESFGMVILEAIANGLAIIANDVYAVNELVLDGENGYLLEPPLSKWDGVMPNRYFMDNKKFMHDLHQIDKSRYVNMLENAIIALATDEDKRKEFQSKSLIHFQYKMKET